MKLLILIPACLVYSIAASPFDKEWHDWKIKYNQNFGASHLDTERYEVFKESRTFVKLHNERFENGVETYKVELNKLAAMTEEEVALRYKTRLRPDGAPSLSSGGLEYNCPNKFKSDGSSLPTLVSYSQGKSCTGNDESTCTEIPIWSTSVKDQGSCGSCWAFGTAVAVEGNLCKQGRFDCTTWTGVSAQQMVDCGSKTSRRSDVTLTPYDNFACNGGFQNNALRYLTLNNNMINSWDDYSYFSGDTRRMGDCEYNQNTAIDNVQGDDCGTIKVGDEGQLAQVVNEIGALTIGIDSSGKGFDLYKEGIYSKATCGSRNNQLDHAVGLTGYGVYPFGSNNPTAYWEVKNSWGPDWGMDGYILFQKDDKNACGVATDAAYVVG